jgi:hypothetical protein
LSYLTIHERDWFRNLLRPTASLVTIGLCLLGAVMLSTGAASAVLNQPHKTSTDRATDFDGLRAKTEVTEYRGRRAIKLVPTAKSTGADGDMFAILRGLDFADGTIEVDVAGAPRAGSEPNMRGFIGVAFHVQPDGAHFDMFYLRPVNARVDDQLVRNHTSQYVSGPDYNWPRLRQESPGVYESYVDVETGAWTHVKITVKGKQARLYVNHAGQPCLIVNDLKSGGTPGRVALWAHVTTEAFFSHLKVQ